MAFHDVASNNCLALAAGCYSAKISSQAPGKDGQVLCVYTRDYMDEAGFKRNEPIPSHQKSTESPVLMVVFVSCRYWGVKPIFITGVKCINFAS